LKTKKPCGEDPNQVEAELSALREQLAEKDATIEKVPHSLT